MNGTEAHNPPRRNSMINDLYVHGVEGSSARNETLYRNITGQQQVQNGGLFNIASFAPATQLGLDQPIDGAPLPQAASPAEERKTYEDTMAPASPTMICQSLAAYKRCLEICPRASERVIPCSGVPLQISGPTDHNTNQSAPQALTLNSEPRNARLDENSMCPELSSMRKPNLVSWDPFGPPPLGINPMNVDIHVSRYFAVVPFTKQNLMRIEPLPSNLGTHNNIGNPLRTEGLASSVAPQFIDDTHMSEALSSSSKSPWNSGNPLGTEGSASSSGVSFAWNGSAYQFPAHQGVCSIGANQAGSSTGDSRGTNEPQPSSSHVRPQFEGGRHQNTNRNHEPAMGQSRSPAPPPPDVPLLAEFTPRGYDFLKPGRSPRGSTIQNIPQKRQRNGDIIG